MSLAHVSSTITSVQTFTFTFNALVSINVVTLRWARLVPGWVIVFGRVNYLGMNQTPTSTQPGHPSVGRCNEYQLRLGR